VALKSRRGAAATPTKQRETPHLGRHSTMVGSLAISPSTYFEVEWEPDKSAPVAFCTAFVRLPATPPSAELRFPASVFTALVGMDAGVIVLLKPDASVLALATFAPDDGNDELGRMPVTMPAVALASATGLVTKLVGEAMSAAALAAPS
jgi:hypothetical protein